jgi:hypothetical protein
MLADQVPGQSCGYCLLPDHMDSKQKMASVVLMPQYLVTGQAPYGKIYIRTAEISAAEELKESWESRGFTDVRIKNYLDGCDDVA